MRPSLVSFLFNIVLHDLDRSALIDMRRMVIRGRLKSFSQRRGLMPVRSSFQINSMDAALRNSLWNALFDCYLPDMERRIESFGFPPNKEPIFAAIWGEHMKRRLDDIEMNSWQDAYTAIAEHFTKCVWYEFYDLIEFVAGVDDDLEKSRDFMTRVNKILERENWLIEPVKSTAAELDQFLQEYSEQAKEICIPHRDLCPKCASPNCSRRQQAVQKDHRL